MKHGGGSVMFWGCFAASGTGYHKSVQGTMKSQDYQGILEQNVLPVSESFVSVAGHGSSNRIKTQSTQLKTPKNDLEQNIGLFWCGHLWALIQILMNICERSWNMQSGEDILQTWDSWSSLLTRSGPEYLLTVAVVSLRVTEIAWLHWLPQKVVQQNIKLRVPSFLSRPFSLVFFNSFVEPQFKSNVWFSLLIFSKFLFIITFVSFKLFQWPLWVFLSLTTGYQQYRPRVYIGKSRELKGSTSPNQIQYEMLTK